MSKTTITLNLVKIMIGQSSKRSTIELLVAQRYHGIKLHHPRTLNTRFCKDNTFHYFPCEFRGFFCQRLVEGVCYSIPTRNLLFALFALSLALLDLVIHLLSIDGCE